ncbi:DUF805 domain-containing protein [Emticicia fontis]
MFKAAFSFQGRIRRAEFGLTVMINVFSILIIFAFIGASNSLWFLLGYFPVAWLTIAQGVKRCHDLDRNGWYQLIPFYFFWMLFQDGDRGDNQYGLNPKGVGNEDAYDEMISQIGKSLKS